MPGAKPEVTYMCKASLSFAKHGPPNGHVYLKLNLEMEGGFVEFLGVLVVEETRENRASRGSYFAEHWMRF